MSGFHALMLCVDLVILAQLVGLAWMIWMAATGRACPECGLCGAVSDDYGGQTCPTCKGMARNPHREIEHFDRSKGTKS